MVISKAGAEGVGKAGKINNQGEINAKKALASLSAAPDFYFKYL
jgi:hypothetical protein